MRQGLPIRNNKSPSTSLILVLYTENRKFLISQYANFFVTEYLHIVVSLLQIQNHMHHRHLRFQPKCMAACNSLLVMLAWNIGSRLRQI